MTWADRSKPGRIRHGPAQLTGHRIGTMSFFLDVLETQRGRTLAAGADREFYGRGRRSAAVLRRGGGGSRQSGGGVLGTHLLRACMHTRLGQPRLHEQAATPASFKGRRPASSARKREATELGNRGREAWLNNGERGMVAATSTISSSAELRDEPALTHLNGEDQKGADTS
jgi:hypothetical protein